MLKCTLRQTWVIKRARTRKIVTLTLKYHIIFKPCQFSQLLIF